jgi:hypothetical protein
MLYWQTVLVDTRLQGSGRRWPPAWRPERDFIHLTGPVRSRGHRGSSYLTNDVVYADLGRTLSLRPSNLASPLGPRASSVIKRLYPLDSTNRAFVLSIVFSLASFEGFDIESIKPKGLPYATMLGSDGWGEVSAESIASWCSDLTFNMRSDKEPVALALLGTKLAEHLTAVTAIASEAEQGKIRPVGNALYLQSDLRFEPNYRTRPDLIIDRPPSIKGRPFVAIAALQAPRSLERRLRIFTLRTFAEVDLANYLNGVFGRDDDEAPPWTRNRGLAALEYLERDSPYAFSGDVTRRVWQLSVARPGAGLGTVKKLARDRLAEHLRVNRSGYSNDNIIVMGDIYHVGQAGAVGPNARSGDVNFYGTVINMTQLKAELEYLESQIESHSPTDPDLSDVRAAIAAASGDDQAVLESRLKRLSKRVISLVTDLGLAVAGAAIARAAGIG